MFDEKLVFANSPSLCPSPVKSNLRTADPAAARACGLIRVAAARSFEHVKQCANSAVARRGPAGVSMRPARVSPSAFWNSILWLLPIAAV